MSGLVYVLVCGVVCRLVCGLVCGLVSLLGWDLCRCQWPGDVHVAFGEFLLGLGNQSPRQGIEN